MTHHSTRSEDRITLALACWVIGGLFLDGYAHTYVIDTATEDFFTPWHAIFYAGFAALAAWVGVLGHRRRRPGPLLDWFPTPYRLTVLGLVLFALGGVGDGIWHTVFGVEVGIDALLSPTHLRLLTGGFLILWTPVRASSARGDTSPWLAVGTVAIVTSVLVFFTEYLWVIPWPWYAQQPFDAETGLGVDTVRLFLASAFVITGVLVGPLVMVARRWPLPVGAATLTWGVSALLEALAFSQRVSSVVLALIGGAAFDAVLMVLRGRSWALRAAAGIGPAVLFSAYLIRVSLEPGGVAWPPEIWGGLVVMTAFVGVGLVLLQELGSPSTATPEPR